MLTIDLLDDETAIGMKVHVQNGSFTGTGLAYFTDSQIKQFSSDLLRLCRDASVTAEIEGGLFENGQLSLSLVKLSCKCIGAGIRARMLIRVAAYPYTGCSAEELSVLTVPLEFPVDVVERFAKELETLPNHLELR